MQTTRERIGKSSGRTRRQDSRERKTVRKGARGKISKAETSERIAAETNKTTTKSAQVLTLLHRRTGATIAQIQGATGWQAHSVRGFISGTVKKKLGLSVTSDRDKDGERRYRIVKAVSSSEG